jgi:benzoyl-CoA reductase/2-hydroxyglutaryl-CoA dehydratase subunit BcrC/BadD/HgdB
MGNGTVRRVAPEERARITEIQDFLIDRYVEQKEAFENGDDARAKEIALEIKELQREKEEIKEWAAT